MTLSVQISTVRSTGFGRGGFSLIEILIALLMFTIIAVGVTHSTLTTTQANREAQRQGVAVNVAHQVLECVKSQLRAGRTININAAGQDCNPVGVPAGFTIADVAVTPGTGAFAGLTQVRIRISWRTPLPDSILFDWMVDT